MSKRNKVLIFKKYQKENKFSRRFWVTNYVRDQSFFFFADTVLQKSTNLLTVDSCLLQCKYNVA